MPIRVRAEFVASFRDTTYEVWVTISNPAEHEKRRAHVVFRETIEDLIGATRDERSVLALESVPFRWVIEARNINDVKPILDIETQCMQRSMRCCRRSRV